MTDKKKDAKEVEKTEDKDKKEGLGLLEEVRHLLSLCPAKPPHIFHHVSFPP